MREAFSIIVIVLSVAVTALILLQSKGADLGGFLGGGDSGVKRTRRGVEAVMHNVTIAAGAAFFICVFITFFLWGG